MTQEEKQLIFIDISSRLLYGIVVQQSPKYLKGDIGYNTAYDSEKETKDFNIIGIESDNCLITDKNIVENTYSKGKVSTPITICIYDHWTGQTARSYLRPMSSMTESERKEYEEWHEELESGRTKDWKYAEYLDWLNAHHFDYRGLIEKGLALEAQEGMYKID